MIKTITVLILFVVSQCNSRMVLCNHPEGGFIPLGEWMPLRGCSVATCIEKTVVTVS
ncbi:unnamed protein product [Tenebrio molitor]|nr:unnamed protein product [Tenebrio molitor]